VSRLHIAFIVSACTTRPEQPEREREREREEGYEEVAGPAETYSKPGW